MESTVTIIKDFFIWEEQDISDQYIKAFIGLSSDRDVKMLRSKNPITEGINTTSIIHIKTTEELYPMNDHGKRYRNFKYEFVLECGELIEAVYEDFVEDFTQGIKSMYKELMREKKELMSEKELYNSLLNHVNDYHNL